MEIARSTPVTRAPASSPPSASAPRTKPTTTGEATAIRPGNIISLIAAAVAILTQRAESASASPSIRPLIVRNCRLTSSIILNAARPTAFIVIAENRNGRVPPKRSPIRVRGFIKLIDSSPAAVENAANNARAVKAAEPIANPFPIAAVVFPAESSASVLVLTCFGSPAISAIPPALSATGPYASTAKVIPRVESIPTALIAIP